MRFCFFHSAEFPQVQGRTAATFFIPIAEQLIAMGHQVLVAAPSGFVNPVPFQTTEDFMRWAQPENVDVVALWTDKPQERRLADILRSRGLKVLFAELGFEPHYQSVYFDEEGCGPESSLARYKPPRANKYIVPDRGPTVFRANAPVGVLLQIEGDYSWRSSPFPNSYEFVNYLQQTWKRPLIVRPHPGQQDVNLPEGTILHRHGKLSDLCGITKAVVGLNSSALFECLALGYCCYMLADGVGYGSGAFITSMQPPDIERPQYSGLRAKAADLLEDLIWHRQIRIDRPVDRYTIENNRVLGALLCSPSDNSSSSPIASTPTPVPA